MIAETEFTEKNKASQKKKNMCESVKKRKLNKLNDANLNDELNYRRFIDENQRPSFFPGY